MYETEFPLKSFCPIALSNVSNKLLTSVLAKRMSLWLEWNKGIAFVQSAVFFPYGVNENTLFVSEALRLKNAKLLMHLIAQIQPLVLMVGHSVK